MSLEYSNYLTEHVSNVQKAGEKMLSYGIVPFDRFEVRRKFGELLQGHDRSKVSCEEYDAYDDYFYGKEQADPEDVPVIDACFDYAWLHHIHQNPHHWQHWVLIEDEGKMKALEMPEEEAYHMIADWWSFSLKAGSNQELLDWYEAHKGKMVLHEKTQALVEAALEKIKALFVDTEIKMEGEAAYGQGIG